MATAKTTGVWVGRSRRFWVLSLAALVLGSWAPPAKAQACDQTLSVGADVAAAVSSAANGTTVCLNDGDYGAFSVTNVERTGFVTVRSTNGRNASLSLNQVWGSSFIKFDSLSIGYASVNNGSHHVEFLNSTFAPDGSGLVFNLETVPATDTAFAVDGCTFDRVSTALFSGRLSVRGVRGLKVTNSVFSGAAAGTKADGVMLVGGARDVEIGPGNVFRDILQAAATAGEHVDSIQMFGAGPNNKIIGNYFHDADVFIMAPDGSSTVTVENNVFDGAVPSYQFKIQFGSTDDTVFRHNTVRGFVVSFDSKPADPASSNVLAENNILVDAGWKTSSGNGCSNCTFQSNLFDDAGNASGTGNIIGVPTFAGGSSPTTYDGWALATGSVGEGAGNDGLDMGALIDGQEPPPPPPPPPTPETVVRGVTVMSFDHDGLNTDSYELCWETTSGVSCMAITVTPVDGTDEKTFVMPEEVPVGAEVVMGLVAVGPSGRASGPTAVFEVTDPAPPPPPAPTTPSEPRISQ